MAEERNETLITLTADIVAAHVANNNIAVSDVPLIINNVHCALAGLGATAQPEPELKPAVSVRASVKPDYVVCLEDGKKMKMLKRHLNTDHGLTPAEYRAKWNLPADYPMVAPNYATQRRELAVKIGLGRKPGQKRAARKKT
jgi:predicted transcriptional regulator